MSTPVPRYLRGDVDAATVAAAFNQFQQDVIDALSVSSASVRENISFQTPASGDAVVRITSGLNVPAKLVVCGWLKRLDGLAVGGPWSIEANNFSTTEITVTFTGLAASTSFTANFEVR